MRNLIKKILKEDGVNKPKKNPLQWIIDEPIGITLQPNTLYYFEPTLNIDEVVTLANLITNAPIIKEWLLRFLDRPRFVGGVEKIKYFVTDETGKDTIGWCTETDIEWAKGMYPRTTPVDGRIEFGL